MRRPGSAARRARAAVADGVHRVQAQAVEAVFHQPVQRVVDEELAHLRLVEIDRRAPGRGLSLVEELRRVGVQVIAVRAEVVVDHVEVHAQAEAVGGVDQALQVFRRAVGGVGCVGQHAVIAPVAPAGEVGHRHQLQRGHAQRQQLRQALAHAGKAAAPGAGVHLVDHALVPGTAAPGLVRPFVGARVDHHAPAVHVVGLRARSRVRHGQVLFVAVAEAVAVARAGAAGGGEMEGAVVLAQHRLRRAAFDLQPHGGGAGRPQGEARALGAEQLGAVGQGLGEAAAQAAASPACSSAGSASLAASLSAGSWSWRRRRTVPASGSAISATAL